VSSSTTSADDGSYVDVFVSIAFKRFSGRKVIVAPDAHTYRELSGCPSWRPILSRPF
jgi:hypothetical protein